MQRWVLCVLTLWPASAAAEPHAAEADAAESEEVEPSTLPDDCGWLVRAGAPVDSPCHHPGSSRAVLFGASGLAAAAGTWWFLSGGDSYRSGDPAGQAIGIGLVGVAGAAIGGVTRVLSRRERDAAVRDRPGRPTARLSIGAGGASALDEAVPVSFGIALDPTFELTDRIQVQPHLGLSPGLQSTVDVDPRPQNDRSLDGQITTFPVGRTVRRTRASVGAEFAWRTRAPRADARPRLEIRWRPVLEIRHRTLHPDTPMVQRQQHLALMPANLGFRWHVSMRQRFTWFVGPRIDWVGFSEPGQTQLAGAGRPVWGPLYAEAYYQIDMPVSRGRGPWNVTGRFNLGYLHTNLDGQSLDTGAIIGFFGPVDVSYDFRFRRGEARQALQLTIGQRVGHGGGAYLELGAVLGGAS